MKSIVTYAVAPDGTTHKFDSINDTRKFMGTKGLANILKAIKTGLPLRSGARAGWSFYTEEEDNRVVVPEEYRQYPRTRKEAKESNAKYYFPGTPCKHGHVALRVTKGTCTECQKVEWTERNKKQSGQPRTEAQKRAARNYYRRHKEKILAKQAQLPRELKRKYNKVYRDNNREAVQASCNAWKRRAREATPAWMTRADKSQINKIYKQARSMTQETGERHVVDHIVPLTSDIVCGLHVPWNLRVVPNTVNAQKSNKLDEALILST